MNEYLRDLTREDVMALLPWVIDPWDDPDLRMPPLGQRPGEGPGREDADGPAEVEARPASVDAKSRMAQRSPGVTPKVPSPLQQPQRRAPAHRASTANVVCIYSPLGDPGAPTCDACCQPASPDAPLTACSRCGTHIHASCHSDGGAPLPDPWVCEGCEEAERLGRDPECCVCLRTGGVLKHVAGPGGAPGTSMAHQFCAQVRGGGAAQDPWQHSRPWRPPASLVAARGIDQYVELILCRVGAVSARDVRCGGRAGPGRGDELPCGGEGTTATDVRAVQQEGRRARPVLLQLLSTGLPPHVCEGPGVPVSGTAAHVPSTRRVLSMLPTEAVAVSL